MSDDFGTVNVRRGDRSREIESLRQRFRAHRDAISQLASDPPSEYLAAEYQRLVAGIDDAVLKLDELEHRPGSGTLSGAAGSAARRSLPGNQPLVTPPLHDNSFAPVEEGVSTPGSSRVLLIVVAGLIVLGLIGWLIWRASSDRKVQPGIVERSATAPVTESAQAPQEVPVPEPEPAPGLKVKPATADYGTIRKGTRAVRQFDVTNATDGPLTLEVSRSTCRCLYYDYHAKVAAKGHETVTVTVDGARAKVGGLDEQVTVKTKENPQITATLGVHAVIK